MFKNTCTFSSLFRRRNSKCEHNGREAETDEERMREENCNDEMMSWLFNWVDIVDADEIYCLCFYFSIALMNFPRLWKPFIFVYNPFFLLAKYHHERAKTDTKGNIFFAALSRFDAYSHQSEYIAVLCQRRIICTIMTLCRLQFLT